MSTKRWQQHSFSGSRASFRIWHYYERIDEYTKRRFVVALFIALILVALTAAAYALVYDKSYYDRIAWTWEYYAPASTSYNCLGYATGSYYWEWPWSGYPLAML